MKNALKNLLIAAIAIGCAVFLSSCAVSLLNFIIPRSGYTIHKNIAYGPDTRQQLDIYVPDNLQKPAPVIVFFYGGSWQFGSKDDYLFAGQAFASKGYIAVIADYRLYPQVYFPAFLQDCAAAFTWVHAHINDYGGNEDDLFLAGHSAGAYNALMLALNPVYIEGAHGDLAWIKGVIGISGPYDFLPFTDPKIIALFSTSTNAATQPIHFVRADMPPVFLATGDSDTLVYPKNTYHLTATLQEFHDPVEMHIYPGLGHIGAALSLANGFRSKAPLLDDIRIFVNAVNAGTWAPADSHSAPAR